ncbi:hypothetical protein FWD07_01540 [Candidatus Saccharibacteria bacterium]|nr:hypothetical protein [Candidatus Saccharibacteria bacterium]
MEEIVIVIEMWNFGELASFSYSAECAVVSGCRMGDVWVVAKVATSDGSLNDFVIHSNILEHCAFVALRGGMITGKSNFFK